MSEKVRWGILGAAEIARKAIVPAIMAAKNAEVVAIGSSSLAKADAFADPFQIQKRYASYEEVLADNEVDAVYIPLPNHLHAEWVKKAAESGKHVLVEKPAAMTVEETQYMIDVCRQHGVLFMEAFMYQFHPQHQRVKELIKQGEIGEVHLMRSTFSYLLDVADQNIRLNREMGGGSLFDVGCYCIHVSRFILEEEPTHVFASGHMHPELEVDLSVSGILSFASGVNASFDCSFQQPFDNKYEVIGSLGKIEVPMAFRPDVHDGKGDIIITDQSGESRKESLLGDQYTIQIEHFSACVQNNEQPSYSDEETIKNMTVIKACLNSLEEKKVIVLS